MTIDAVRAAPGELRNIDLAITRHGAFGRLWLDAMWQGDPLADAVVTDGARDVRRALAHGIDAVDDPSPALAALFAAIDTPPAWMDLDRCDRASAALVRQGREYGFVLGAASLLAGAQNRIASKPLTFTGRYASNAAVRSIEVGTWLTAITSPGGLRREAPGFEHTVRVRMIHAHVRAHLQRKPEWELEAWGVPIPQPYMAFTLAEFCSIALRAATRIGARFTDRETEDVVHLWRCVGHLVGVDPALLPATLGEYARIEDLYALTSPGADDDGRRFVDALATFQADELGRVVPRRWARPVVDGLQRAFVGDELADALDIPDRRLRHLPRVVGPLTAAANALHDRLVPGGRTRRTARAARLRERELVRLRQAYGVTHDLVDAAT